MKEYNQKLTDFTKNWGSNPDFAFISQLKEQFPKAGIYLVGGAVRDIILDRETKDFDFVITKVDTKDLEKLLSKLGKVNLVGKSFGVFKFVPKDSSLGEDIDIALPRTEQAGMSGGYKDFEIQSDKDLPIEEDLGRRDFTINALAWDMVGQKLVDEFSGLKDLETKTIRAIGNPETRFQEDYTRMLRAIRFSAQLDYKIESKTKKIIEKKIKEITTIAPERINEELTKIIMSDNAENGIRLMQKIGMLNILIPELESGVGVKQNKAHIYEVFEHNVRALGAGATRGYKLEIRLAALFHDVSKPETKEGDGPDASFHNHEIVGATIVRKILKRLNYSNDIVKYVTHLVRYHMFYYALDIVTDAGVRRLLNRLGKENIDDFINVRICDRLGMGRPKAKPWKLIQLERRFKEVELEPITPRMVKLSGDELMPLLKLKPGPKIGLLLNALLGEVLENPELNKKELLIKRVKELNKLDDKELKKFHPDIKFYEEEQKRMVHHN
jgi:tRNA nucleotidyltransferase (CCA-adding enzyme)